jgi:hypothetical protein
MYLIISFIAMIAITYIRVITKLPNSEQSYTMDFHIVKMHKDMSKNFKNIFFINVWRKSVFNIYFTEIGAALTTILPVLFEYCYKYCYKALDKIRGVQQTSNQLMKWHVYIDCHLRHGCSVVRKIFQWMTWLKDIFIIEIYRSEKNIFRLCRKDYKRWIFT